MQRFQFLVGNSVLYFLLYASFTVTAQQRESIISRGSSLVPTAHSSWLSRSGLYAFGFYRQGEGYAVGIFLAGIPQKTVVWTANRDDPPVSSRAILEFKTDGRLVLQSTQGQDGTDIAQETASYASMLDSGNLVLCNSSGGIIWQSFDHPTDTLLAGQRLLAGGENLFPSVSETDHSTGKFRLAMQRDGNLVQYPRDGASPSTAYWSSQTAGAGDQVSLNLELDGHLYLLNSTSSNIKNLTEGSYPRKGIIYLMRVDWDGIFRLYSYNLTRNSSWSVVWESSKDRCDPTGLCGFNSYCILIDQDPDCPCLPGFVSVSQGNWTSGCQRNFTGSCMNSLGTPNSTIRELENTMWEDVSYLILSQKNKDDCKEACLMDCNCEAALFDNEGNCRLQRLPLRFGKRELTSTSNYIAMIKVYTGFSPDSSMPKAGKKELRRDIIIFSCLFVAFVLVTLATSGIVIYRYHVWSYGRIPGNGHIRFCEDIAPISFSHAEIEKLTEGFKEEVGRGSSGTVYKGIMMNSKKVVAVKKIEKVLDEGEREFLTEMKVIGRTHHRNLVRLHGYSADGPSKFLVYEYMSNGSLSDILFTADKQPNWVERMEISRDIARGILYLHNECETQIIHCDIKPHNILMDANRCAKISDFGLAKLLKPEQTNTFTRIRGTRGYVAPEWHRNMPITFKVDIYSFGVMLLEIICCRRFMDQNVPDDQVILEDWVYQCFEAGELYKLIGNEEVELKQLERMVKVALWCILDEPSLRPSMKKVLLMLEGTVDIPTPPNPTSYFSTI